MSLTQPLAMGKVIALAVSAPQLAAFAAPAFILGHL